MIDHPALNWLLEPDDANPGVRLFALTRLLGRPPGDPEVQAARRAIMTTGPVPVILDAQWPGGYWDKPGAGYGPKYRGTIWSVVFLAMLGADPADPRVHAGGDYVLGHSRSPYGGFTIAENLSPSLSVHCLEGNLCAALLDLGFAGDPRLDAALDWLARSITGEGIAPSADAGAARSACADAPRYYRSGNSGPGFLCSANNQRPCAWGAVKAMLALGKVAPANRTPAMTAAIDRGIEFLLSRDPAVADYPMPEGGAKPNGSWFKFGYPLGYVTDVLQNLEALTGLGLRGDPRLARALDLVRSKQDARGRWTMSYTYNGKMWANVETPGKPSKWVTLRALSVL